MLRHLNHLLGPAAAAVIAGWLDPAWHAHATRRLVTQALADGKIELALCLAERRCRLQALPSPLDLVLRAQALRLSGDPQGAARDLAEALAIDPDDLLANRQLLTAGSEPHLRSQSALRLIELDREPATVAAALAVLRDTGTIAVARASMIDGAIRGWAAWSPQPAKDEGDPGDGGQTIVVEHGDAMQRLRLKADPRHPLGKALGAAASFVVASRVGHGQWMAARADAGPLLMARAFTGFGGVPPDRSRARHRRGSSESCAQVTVIVPVHGDLAATRACLDSLLRSIAGETLRVEVIVVDDASPEPGMADYLAGLPVDLVTNPKNLGFVGSVNAALERVAGGDIVLLNADTIVPAGAIGRLHAIATASKDIGTITPLSNNGELTSLPLPFRENPLPDEVTLARIDAVARDLGGGEPAVFDLPAGIGFCLYVTRAALDAVGGLSERYERGYGEDVHLCLAAREAGWRSVCATSVYVGHAGSRSFGAQKRRLVMRNAARVAARFPDHEREVASFVAADPLRRTRHAVGRRLLRDFAGEVVVSGRAGRAQAEAYLQSIASLARPALLASFDRGEATWSAYDANGALVAQTSFVLPRDADDMAACRGSLRCERLAVFSPSALEAMEFTALAAPFDLHMCDAGDVVRRAGADRRGKPPACWRLAIARADRIIAPDAMAQAFVAAWKPAAGKPVTAVASARKYATPAARSAHRLGVVLLDETPGCRQLLRVLAAHLPRGPDLAPPVVVIGRTADDTGLMRSGGLMITGKIAPAETAAIAHQNGVSHILLISDAPHFGAPMARAAECLDLPLARFDWSGRGKAVEPDLAIPADLDDDGVAQRIAHWLAMPGTLP